MRHLRGFSYLMTHSGEDMGIGGFYHDIGETLQGIIIDSSCIDGVGITEFPENAKGLVSSVRSLLRSPPVLNAGASAI